MSPRSRISGSAAPRRPRAASRIAGGLVGRLREGGGAGGAREVVEAKAQDDRATHAPGLSHATGDTVDEPDQCRVDLLLRPPPPPERALGPDRPPAPPGLDGSRVAVVCERVEVAARRPAEQRDERLDVDPRDLAHGAEPAGVQPARGGGADAPQPFDREGVEEGDLLVGLDDQEAVGLRDRARDLGEELRSRDADGDAQSDVLEDVAAEADGDLGRRPGDPLEPSNVEERLVDRQSLDERRRVVEHAEHRSARIDVGVEARRDDDRLRAEPARLRSSHRSPDAEGLRLVARRQHDPAADDHGPSAQPRVVALLDRREERVEIRVQDRRRAHTNICSHTTEADPFDHVLVPDIASGALSPPQAAATARK